MITGRRDNGKAISNQQSAPRNVGGSSPGCAGGSAFTLLELILVMVLISVLLGVAAPSLRGFYGARGSADAAAQLLSMTNYARSQAIAEGTIYRLNIDTGERTYWLTAQIGGAYVELNNEYGRRFILPETMTVEVESPSGGMPSAGESRRAGSENPSYIQFYPSGRNDEATIKLVGMQGEVFGVTSPSATEPFRIVSLPPGGRSEDGN